MTEKTGNKKLKATTGYSENGLPYFRLGNKSRILVVFDGLNFENKPPSGLQLRWVAGDYKQIAKDYTVYSVGRKPDLPSGYSTRDMANDYADMVRNELKWPVDVLGLSTGGTIAQYFALDHPDLVRRLVLGSTGYALSENGKKLQLYVGDMAKQRKWRKAYTAMMDGVYPEGGLKRLFFKLVMSIMTAFSKPSDPSDVIVTIEAEDQHNFKDLLGEIKVPTLVIGGEDDFFYPIRETAEGILAAKVILYEGFGHNAWLDNRRQFQEDVLAFLNEGL
ncbi:MAG: alpha/beta hydrolase [Candidatus Bathyarchaeota archaeon]|nr:alpha/beta hydrolase [Candidatus Bathyarchaeum sp.]